MNPSVAFLLCMLFGIFCYIVGRFVERHIWCETGRSTKLISCRHKEKQRIFHVAEQDA